MARLNALETGPTRRWPVDCWWRASIRSSTDVVSSRGDHCVRRYRDGLSLLVVGLSLPVESSQSADSRLAGTRSDVLAAPIAGRRKHRIPQSARWFATAIAIGLSRS